jgi:hypothetical protein
MFKTLMLFAALGASIASAKSYEITLDNAVSVGDVKLTPGKYSFSVMDESKVRFTASNGQAVEARAKVSTSDRKFENTMVDTKQVNGSVQVDEIDLGGTKTRVQFE